MLASIRIPLLACLCLGAARTLTAQTTALSPSPTLPSDTLEANYGPRSAAGPTPDISPTLPSDTLEATQPVDSFPTEPFLDDSISVEDDAPADQGVPQSAADSAALRDLRIWMEHHPDLMAPPPVRAVLVRV